MVLGGGEGAAGLHEAQPLQEAVQGSGHLGGLLTEQQTTGVWYLGEGEEEQK